eukprot:14830951-Ditylum_brightwellii.AAC.1
MANSFVCRINSNHSGEFKTTHQRGMLPSIMFGLHAEQRNSKETINPVRQQYPNMNLPIVSVLSNVFMCQ